MHTKKGFFVLYVHSAVSSCGQSAAFWSGQPDKRLTSGSKRRALAAFWSCQLDKRLTGCLVDKTKTRPKLGVLVRSTDPSDTRQSFVWLIKTSRFVHSSTLQCVYIGQKKALFRLTIYTHQMCK
ncbi:hypothetical protein Hanom_Chr08g00707301 [Helianthus anomalus]